MDKETPFQQMHRKLTEAEKFIEGVAPAIKSLTEKIAQLEIENADLIRQRAILTNTIGKYQAELEGHYKRPDKCPRCGTTPFRTFEGACEDCGEPHK